MLASKILWRDASGAALGALGAAACRRIRAHGNSPGGRCWPPPGAAILPHYEHWRARAARARAAFSSWLRASDRDRLLGELPGTAQLAGPRFVLRLDLGDALFELGLHVAL